MQSVGGALSAAVTAPLLGVGAAAIAAAADQEQLQIAFSTMLGSAERAAAMVENLNEFAAKTPFQAAEVQNAAKMLIGYGVAAEDVTETMRRLGDISAGLNIPLGDMAYLFGTARVQGRLFAADINQFSNRGIPIIAALAETMGVAQESIRGMVEEGRVGFPELQAALTYLTEEGSQFGGLMEAQSQSINGMFSTLRDNIVLSLAAIGETIVEQFDLKTKLASALVWTEQMTAALMNLAATNPELFRLGAVIAGVAATAGPALLALGTAVTFAGTAIGGLGAALGVLLSPVGLLIAAVAALGAAWYFNFGGIQEITAGAVAAVGEFAASVDAMLPAALAAGQTAFAAFFADVQAFAAQVGEFLAPAAARVAAALSGLGENMGALEPQFADLGAAVQEMAAVVQPLIEGLATALGVTLVVAADAGANLLAAAIQNMALLVGPIITQITATIDLLATTVKNVAALVMAVATGDWAGAWDAIRNIVAGFAEYYQTTFNNVATFTSGVLATLKTTVLNTLSDLDAGAKTQMDALADWWGSAWSALTSAFDPIKNGIDSVIGAVENLKRNIETFRGWIGSISIPNPFANIQMPSLPGLPNPFGNNQLGTAYAHGGWSWVGENRRPELVYLPRGAQVVPWQQAKNAPQGGVTINIQNATVRNEQDLWELAYALDELRRRRR